VGVAVLVADKRRTLDIALIARQVAPCGGLKPVKIEMHG
jgi:hypothetical protein